jgi:hypothetical protein
MVFVDDVIITKNDVIPFTSDSYRELREVFNGEIPERKYVVETYEDDVNSTNSCAPCSIHIFWKIAGFLAYMVAIAVIPVTIKFIPDRQWMISIPVIVLMTIFIGLMLRSTNR